MSKSIEVLMGLGFESVEIREDFAERPGKGLSHLSNPNPVGTSYEVSDKQQRMGIWPPILNTIETLAISFFCSDTNYKKGIADYFDKKNYSFKAVQKVFA